jgi:hypothetical protein
MRKHPRHEPWVGPGLAVAASLLLSAAPATAQSGESAPTYAEDIAPIVQVRCHVEGGLGPMPLTRYDEVRRYARRIRQVVLERSMPPWHLDPTIGIQAYNNDISLSRDEIETVLAWVDAGAPEGDPADLPPPPAERWTWGNGWELEARLGPPDVVVNSGPIPIPAEGHDVWPDVVLPWDALDETRFLRAAEIRNTVKGRRALHHNNIRLALEGEPSGRVVGAGASKTYDLFAEDTGLRLDAGPATWPGASTTRSMARRSWTPCRSRSGSIRRTIRRCTSRPSSTTT